VGKGSVTSGPVSNSPPPLFSFFFPPLLALKIQFSAPRRELCRAQTRIRVYTHTHIHASERARAPKTFLSTHKLNPRVLPSVYSVRTNSR